MATGSQDQMNTKEPYIATGKILPESRNPSVLLRGAMMSGPPARSPTDGDLWGLVFSLRPMTISAMKPL